MIYVFLPVLFRLLGEGLGVDHEVPMRLLEINAMRLSTKPSKKRTLQPTSRLNFTVAEDDRLVNLESLLKMIETTCDLSLPRYHFVVLFGKRSNYEGPSF